MKKRAEVMEASSALQRAYARHKKIHDNWFNHQTEKTVKEHAKIVNKIYRLGGQHKRIAEGTKMEGMEGTLHQLSSKFENSKEGEVTHTITNKSLDGVKKYSICVHCGDMLGVQKVEDEELITSLDDIGASAILEPRVCDNCIQEELEKKDADESAYAVCTGCGKDEDGNIEKSEFINKSFMIKAKQVNEDERTFWAVVSADNVDKQGDQVDAEAIKGVMPTFMKRGVLIFGHQNVVVGKPVDWEQNTTEENLTKTYVKFKVFDDFEVDDEFWTKIKSGDISKFSIGGMATEEKTICQEDPKTGQKVCFNRIDKLDIFEISGLPEDLPPANEEANLVDESVNKIAKGMIKKKVAKRGNKWCVIHCHGAKAGQPIKCFETKTEAEDMHRAIQARQHSTKDEEGDSDIQDDIAQIIFDSDYNDLTKTQQNKVRQTEFISRAIETRKNEEPDGEWYSRCVKRADDFTDEPECFCKALYSQPWDVEVRNIFGKATEFDMAKKLLDETDMGIGEIINLNDYCKSLYQEFVDKGLEHDMAVKAVKDHLNDVEEKQDNNFICECIECGYQMESEKHCKNLSCPECGGTMRRKERPGSGEETMKEKQKPKQEGNKKLDALSSLIFEDKYSSLDEEQKMKLEQIKMIAGQVDNKSEQGEKMSDEEEEIEKESEEEETGGREQEKVESSDEEQVEEKEEPIMDKMDIPEPLLAWMKAVSKELGIEFPEKEMMDETEAPEEEVEGAEEEPAPETEEVQASEDGLPPKVQEEIKNLENKMEEKFEDISKSLDDLTDEASTPSPKAGRKVNKQDNGNKIDDMFPTEFEE